MSVETLAVVLNHSRAQGTAKVILLGIANHDGDGGAWPAVATLARYANVDVRRVKRHLKALVDSGELRRHVQAGGTRDTPDVFRPNRYDVLVTCPPGCDRTANHKALDGWKRLTSGAYVPVDNSPEGGVAQTPPGGPDATGGGGADATRTVLRTSDGTGSASVTGSREAGPVPRCEICGGTMARCALGQAQQIYGVHDFTSALAPRRPAAHDPGLDQPGTQTDEKAAARLTPGAVENNGRTPAVGGSPHTGGNYGSDGSSTASREEA